MDVEAQLRAWAAEVRSIRWMADEVGSNYSATRAHLLRIGVQTQFASRLASTSAARAAGLSEVQAVCPVRGLVQMRQRSDGGYRCLACRRDAVISWRRRLKEILVAEAGGSCLMCGYDEVMAALQFHHRDPHTKSFAIAARGSCRSLARARREAAKCILLCANCHAAVEAGVRQLPSPTLPASACGDPG